MYALEQPQTDIRSTARLSTTKRRLGFLWLFLELTKVRITAAVTFTTATGYILFARWFDLEMWLPLLGVFLLACGSAALNQWQERKIDARMQRTRQRPIPSGRIAPSTALFLSGLLILAGFYCVTSVPTNSNVLLALGILALVWYNGVYTYLKRLTAFAVVPGALIGAIPPCMGYVAAGGSLRDPDILLVAVFFFVWQIPHFWLLLLMIGNEYSSAGLPAVTSRFSREQVVRITFVWILATAVAGVAFPALDKVNGMRLWSFAMVAASIWLAAKATTILRVASLEEWKLPVRQAFRYVNVFALLVMIFLSLGALRL